MMLSATPTPALRGLRLWRRLLLLRLCSGSRADPPEAAAVKRGRGGGMRRRRGEATGQWELPSWIGLGGGLLFAGCRGEAAS